MMVLFLSSSFLRLIGISCLIPPSRPPRVDSGNAFLVDSLTVWFGSSSHWVPITSLGNPPGGAILAARGALESWRECPGAAAEQPSFLSPMTWGAICPGPLVVKCAEAACLPTSATLEGCSFIFNLSADSNGNQILAVVGKDEEDK